MTFDSDAYLERLHLVRPEATATGLAALQEAQLCALAFENLDPLTGRLPDLAPAAVWRKLMLDRRGGYCFELNGLFGRALGAFGFSARPVLARVRMGAIEGGARTHLAWVVTIDGEDWLADAGFGGPGPRRPLRLGIAGPQGDGRTDFRIRADRDERVIDKALLDGWLPLYGFDGMVPRPIDIEAANVVCARWERAAFGSVLMLSRRLADGQVTCRNRVGRTERGGRTACWTLDSAADLAARLAEDFLIAAPGDLVEAAWQRIAATRVD